VSVSDVFNVRSLVIFVVVAIEPFIKGSSLIIFRPSSACQLLPQNPLPRVSFVKFFRKAVRRTFFFYLAENRRVSTIESAYFSITLKSNLCKTILKTFANLSNGVSLNKQQNYRKKKT